MISLIAVALATVAISAVCSMLEATLYSASAATLEAARAGGGRRARSAQVLLALKSDIARPTSAILIVNTVANTAGATVVGVLAVRAFGSSALTPVSIGLTLAILFLAEILPKSYAATHWHRLWPVAAWLIFELQRVLAPALWLTRVVTNLAARSQRRARVRKDEVQAMIRLGERSGSINATEAQILDAALRLRTLRCDDVVVSDSDVIALRADALVADAVAQVLTSLHTRYPLCRQGLDDCVGLVHAKDLLAAPPDTPLESLARPIARLPHDMHLDDALRKMQSARLHMVLISDADGHNCGIATLEDLLEQVVGPVMDEFDASRALRKVQLAVGRGGDRPRPLAPGRLRHRPHPVGPSLPAAPELQPAGESARPIG